MVIDLWKITLRTELELIYWQQVAILLLEHHRVLQICLFLTHVVVWQLLLLYLYDIMENIPRGPYFIM